MKIQCIALIGIVVGLVSAGCASSGPSANGPVPLFDGRTFNGWDGDTTTTWRIQEGALVGGTLKSKVPRNEFLATTRSFTNFVLRLQFRLLGSEGFVNAGVQIRSERTTEPPNEMRGYQVDLGDPEWWGCIYDESRRNKVVAKSDVTEVNKVLRRQDWNTYVIRAEGRRIRVWLNEVLTVDYLEPEAGIPQHGRIGLQIHGGGVAEVWYRNIVVEELPPG